MLSYGRVHLKSLSESEVFGKPARTKVKIVGVVSLSESASTVDLLRLGKKLLN